ncbi:hypothetical protein JTB14_022645 [Gonioctena quinquepunctata]|nr:hypothetical protein JTB14_022645 [Gonioctena quinquepunctata]
MRYWWSDPIEKINPRYFTNQEVKLPNYEQPPPLESFRPPPRQTYVKNPQAAVPNTKEKAPAINAPNLYEQFNVPLNATSLYQTFSPGSINQELLGSIQFQPDLGAECGHPKRSRI